MSRFRRRIFGSDPWPPLRDLARPVRLSFGEIEPTGGELLGTGFVGMVPLYGANLIKASFSILSSKMIAEVKVRSAPAYTIFETIFTLSEVDVSKSQR